VARLPTHARAANPLDGRRRNLARLYSLPNARLAKAEAAFKWGSPWSAPTGPSERGLVLTSNILLTLRAFDNRRYG
jgi:hypothetical protein